jgi:hypothetical protein
MTDASVSSLAPTVSRDALLPPRRPLLSEHKKGGSEIADAVATGYRDLERRMAPDRIREMIAHQPEDDGYIKTAFAS